MKIFLYQLRQLLKHRRRVGLPVIDDSDNFSFERIQTRHQRPVFGIDRHSRIEKFDRRHEPNPPNKRRTWLSLYRQSHPLPANGSSGDFSLTGSANCSSSSVVTPARISFTMKRLCP